MGLKSNFKEDLKKEKLLSVLLDSYYKSELRNYSFERVTNLSEQFKGVDILFKHHKKEITYYIDEKAQLDYINDDLPTFAFEISYLKNGKAKEGWLFDENKKTDFYSLITAIYSDETDSYTSCKITLVNRKKLISFLHTKGVNQTSILQQLNSLRGRHGKHGMKELDERKEGYLFVSKENKSEQPINLILRLEFLIQHKLARRLV